MKYRLNSEGTLEEIVEPDVESYRAKVEREAESVAATAKSDIPVPLIIPKHWAEDDPCEGAQFVGCEQQAAENRVYTGQYL